MSLLILIGLTLLLMLLAASGLIGLRSSASVGTAGRRRALALPAMGAGLSLILLLDGGRSAALPVPIGTAGGNGGLQLDALSGLFLLLAFLVTCFAEATAPDHPRDRARRSLGLAALVLALLAGDVFLLAIGGSLTILLLAPGAPASRFGRVSLLSAGCLVGACTLLASLAMPAHALLPGGNFALLRRGLPVGRAIPGSVILLMLLATGAVGPLLGVWPFPFRHRRSCATSAASVPVLSSLLGLFLLLRLLLDLSGDTLPAGCGVALLVLGLISAVQAGVASLRGDRLRPVIGSLLAVQNALAVTATGIGLLAKADDLPVLAAAAIDATLLLVSVQTLAGLAILRLAQAMEEEAGAALLGRLGGLVQSMPYATVFAGVAVAMLAFLPPAGGFGGLWLLLQAALSVSRLGGSALAGLTALGVAGLVAAVGLAAIGWLRLAAVVVLGRPRTPRGAAAQEMSRTLGRAVAVLLALPMLIGLLPGLWLRLLSPIALLLGTGGEADPPPLLRLVAPGGTSSLSPLPLGLLLAVALGGCLWGSRRLATRPERREPGWEGGGAPPPPWLPFGDPLAQIGPRTLPRALAAALGVTQDGSRPPSSGRLAVMRGLRLRTVLAGMRHGSIGLSGLLRARGAVLALLLLAGMLWLSGWWYAA